jgi:hypothetical protein
MAAKINQFLAQSAGNAQEVADAVLRIIETPVGQKKLRYRVSPNSLGVDEINGLCANVQASLLQAFGLTGETRFAQQKAAATD